MAIWLNEFFSGFDLFFGGAWNALAKSAGAFFNPFFLVITFLGEKGIIFFALGLVLLLFKKTRACGICVIGAVGLGAIITNLILKDLVARPRPFTVSPYDEWWVTAGQNPEDGFSFPSGHITAIASASLAVILVWGKKWILPGVGATALMCVSRCYLTAHYSSDALVACIVGAVSAVIAFFITKLIFYICEKNKDKKFFDFILNFDICAKKEKENA